MTPESLAQRIERAEKHWQTAAQGDPGENTWGFYSYCDAPAGIGGGYGVFVWFPDRRAMLDFIANWGEVARQTNAIFKELKDGIIEDGAGLQRLNKELVTSPQIERIGTFEQLTNSDEPSAVRVRTEFSWGGFLRCTARVRGRLGYCYSWQ